MEKKNKNYNRKNFFKKFTIFLGIVFFAWFNLSRADLDGMNIFNDRDQDGLSDVEEKSYGTDPDKKDTDGDGYSDKTEIESGYDPLKPAPGDKIMVEGDKTENREEGVGGEGLNMTEAFLEEIKNYSSGEVGALNEKLTNSEVSQEEIISIIEEEENSLSDVFEKIASSVEEEMGEKEKINPEELKILPIPEGSESEVRRIEKEQIEKYISSTLYILGANRPFELDDINELPEKMTNLVYDLSSDIQAGDVQKIQSYQETIKEIFEQTKKIETPFVLVDVHTRLLLGYLCLYQEIDEYKITSDNDPLAIFYYVGKIQSIFLEFDEIYQELNEILEEYEIEEFDPSLAISGIKEE